MQTDNQVMLVRQGDKNVSNVNKPDADKVTPSVMQQDCLDTATSAADAILTAVISQNKSNL
jgi:hypothetical protein